MAINGQIKTWGVIVATAIAIGSVAWSLGRGDTDSLKVDVDTLQADVTQLKVDSAKVETGLQNLKDSVDRNRTLLEEILRQLNGGG